MNGSESCCNNARMTRLGVCPAAPLNQASDSKKPPVESFVRKPAWSLES
jgi:hypothetical protein